MPTFTGAARHIKVLVAPIAVNLGPGIDESPTQEYDPTSRVQSFQIARSRGKHMRLRVLVMGMMIASAGSASLTTPSASGLTRATDVASPVSPSCPSDNSLLRSSTCLFVVTGRSSSVGPDPRDDFINDAIAIEAVRLAVANGLTEQAARFVQEVEGARSPETFTRLKALLKEEPNPGPGDSLILEGAGAADSGGVTTQAESFGSPKYETRYIDYWVVSSSSTRLVSTTKAEYNQYINRDTVDYGIKALAVHYSKYSGRTTYYSDGDCRIRHVDPFFDQNVMTWGKCASPDYSGANYQDVDIYERDYYGTRGERYYNKFWIDVNPSGAEYPPEQYSHSGPRWKNPDAGGKPFWQ